MPTFSITEEQGYDPSTTKYTVLVLDPDVPSPAYPIDREILGDFNHYVFSDVQPFCITNQQQVVTDSYKAFTPGSLEQHR